MIHVPEDVLTLKAAGYICIPLKPLMWRVRGPNGYVELYPHSEQYRRYSGILQPYKSVLEAVAGLEPWERPSPEQLEYVRVWREGLEKLIAAIHIRRN